MPTRFIFHQGFPHRIAFLPVCACGGGDALVCECWKRSRSLKELLPYGFGYKLSVSFVLIVVLIENTGHDEFSEFLNYQGKVEMFQFSESQLQC